MASARPIDISGGPKSNRVGGGFKAASALARTPVRAVAGKRGIAEARLLTHWREIVGEDLSTFTRPIRVRSDRRGLSLGGVLVLAVAGPRASEVEHQIPRIIERVNGYYGYKAVVEVKLTQAIGRFPTTPAIDEATVAAAPSDLPEEKRQRLDAMTSPILDDQLREALSRLGANVMAKKSGKRKTSA